MKKQFETANNPETPMRSRIEVCFGVQFAFDELSKKLLPELSNRI